MSIFSERLKSTRLQKGLSQHAVASGANIDIRLYQYYEADKRCPAVTTAAQIASVLDVSLDYLVGNSESPHRY